MANDRHHAGRRPLPAAGRRIEGGRRKTHIVRRRECACFVGTFRARRIRPGSLCRGMSRLRDDGGRRRSDGVCDVGSDAECAASPFPARPTCVAQARRTLRSLQHHLIDSATGDVTYVSPPANDIPVLFRNHVQWKNHSNDAHPTIAKAIARLQFGHLHQFPFGIGRMLRLLSML